MVPKSYVFHTAVVFVLLAGCSTRPLTTAIPQGNGVAKSSATRQDLLYITELDGNVEIVTYPEGTPVGSIFYGPYSHLSGECTDRSGNVWITNYSTIDEYPHGRTKPIARKYINEVVTGCSVGRKTNDLAAVGANGHVFIWTNERGKPQTYHTAQEYTLQYCDYDDRGNLFIDGIESYSKKFSFFELASGARKLEKLNLDKKIANPGQVQWDGDYITIQDRGAPHNIYQVKVVGSSATVVNTISFTGLRSPVTASWIQGTTVLIPYRPLHGRFPNALGLFDYPAGGGPTEILKGKVYRVISAVAVSR